MQTDVDIEEEKHMFVETAVGWAPLVCLLIVGIIGAAVPKMHAALSWALERFGKPPIDYRKIERYSVIAFVGWVILGTVIWLLTSPSGGVKVAFLLVAVSLGLWLAGITVGFRYALLIREVRGKRKKRTHTCMENSCC